MALSAAIRIAGALWAIWLMVPWEPRIFGHEPRDSAYVIFSHIAFANGEPWGTVALHTSGPLGFLRFPFFYAPTYVWLLIGTAAIAATAAVLLDYLAASHLRPWARLPFVAGAMCMLALSDDGVWLFLLLVSQLVIPGGSPSPRWTFHPDPRWLTWPLLLTLSACAVAANVKGSFLLMAGVLATELAALELRARRAPVVTAGFVVLIALLAGLAGFRLADWAPYTKHILDSLSGYAESFSQAESLPLALLLIGSVAAIIALDARRVQRCPDRLAAVVQWIALALLLWMSAKGALVRHDGPHWIRTIGSLAAFVATYIVVHRRDWSLWTRVASAAPAIGLGVAFFLAAVDAVPRISLERHMNRVATFFRDGAAFPAAKDAEARAAMEARVRRSSLAEGSIGVFGTWHSLLLGYSGRHVALPVVASYEIWSPWTSRRERDFLLGPEAPDYLLYTASPVSAELAVTLARRYEEIERRPRYRLLRRRAQSLAVNKRVVFDATVDDRRAIAIPAEWRTGPAVAEVRYTKTLANTAISTIYQPPEAFLALSGESGYVAKIRMNALLSGEGIVLSGRPGIWDSHRAALHGMRFGMLNDERTEATTLGFEARGPAGTDWRRYFGSRIHVRIYIPEFW